MSSKRKDQDSGLGDFMVPLIDCLNEILLFTVKMLSKGLYLLLTRYVFKERGGEEKIVKIERDHLKSKKRTLSEDAIGYSINRKKEIKALELDKRKHTLAVGASGFGKSVLLDVLMYDDLCHNKPVIFIDPKGDNKTLEQFINLCRLKRRDFAIFSEYYTGPGKISLNPVKEGSITSIADRIHTSFRWSEEYYAETCYEALLKAITDIKKDRQEVTYKIILDKILLLSDPNDPDRTLDRKELKGIIMKLSKIVNSDFGEILSEGGLSFKEAWESKKCIYIGLPVLGYPMIARSLGKCILGDLAYSVYKTYCTINPILEDKLIPVGVYIDELSAVITDEFIEILNKCRGVKMELNIAFQSPSDIKKESDELCTQVFENCFNWFVLKQRMETEANLLSGSIGTLESTKRTIRVEGDEEKDQGSQRIVEEMIAHTNIIKNLNVGQALLLRHSPTRVDLLNIKYINPKVVCHNVKIAEDRSEIDNLPKIEYRSIEVEETAQEECVL